LPNYSDDRPIITFFDCFVGKLSRKDTSRVVNHPRLIFKKEALIEAPSCLYKGGTGLDVERQNK
jgi:hypothetical protein